VRRSIVGWSFGIVLAFPGIIAIVVLTQPDPKPMPECAPVTTPTTTEPIRYQP
jgi:hypothetical protein